MLHSVAESMCQQMIQDLEAQKTQFQALIGTLSYIERNAASESMRHRAQEEIFKVRGVVTSLERAQAAAVDFDTDTLVQCTSEMREKVLALDMNMSQAA